MTNPIQVDLPHKLGAEEAKRRIAGGIGRLKDFIPGGGEVQHGWTGDRLNLQVTAMGQAVNAQIDVRETFVRVEVVLPPSLAFMRPLVESALRRKGTDMLEDASGRRSG
ncbi:MAG: polyhydroxyalkanoic acid system family protein [Pseudomonadota bacterium]|nr:polyhydroxyalkanoic acid system family protein [Pseudomonadota bacterium]